jgi:hypothetical protein
MTEIETVVQFGDSLLTAKIEVENIGATNEDEEVKLTFVMTAMKQSQIKRLLY